MDRRRSLDKVPRPPTMKGNAPGEPQGTSSSVVAGAGAAGSGLTSPVTSLPSLLNGMGQQQHMISSSRPLSSSSPRLPPTSTTMPQRQQQQLPRHVEEQLMALYLRYDGVTFDKIPNLVAELNLTIPVDFSVDKYFRSHNGARQLILQPNDLCQFVLDLQSSVDHPNNGVNDTCQVLLNAAAAAAHAADVVDRGESSMFGMSRSMSSANSYTVAANTAGPGSMMLPDHIDRNVIEAALTKYFPDGAVTRAAASTIFAPPQSQPSSETAVATKQTSSASMTNAKAQQQQQQQSQNRQSLEQFRQFLESDNKTQTAVLEVFRRFGCSDEGYGLCLTMEAFEESCNANRLRLPPSLMALALRSLDVEHLGEVELSAFETVLLQQVRAAATAAAASSSTSSSSSSDVSASSTSPQVMIVAMVAAALAPSAVISLTNHQVQGWLLDQLNSACIDNGGLPHATIITSAGGIAAGGGGVGSSFSRPATSGARGGGGGGGGGASSSAASGGGATSSSVMAASMAVGGGGGQQSGNTPVNTYLEHPTGVGAGGVLQLQRQQRRGSTDDTDDMLGDLRLVSKQQQQQRRHHHSEAKVALPRFMQQKPDDEITAAVKLRAQQRRLLERQRSANSSSSNLDGSGRSQFFRSLGLSPHSVRRATTTLSDDESLQGHNDIMAATATPSPRRRPHSCRTATLSHLSDPKGFALLRAKREPHEALSSGGSLTERFMVNHNKTVLNSGGGVIPQPPPSHAATGGGGHHHHVGNNITAIIEGALSHHNNDNNNNSEHEPSTGTHTRAVAVPANVAALLADPYAHPTPRFHSSKEVHYVYRRTVDSWRESPRRSRSGGVAAN